MPPVPAVPASFLHGVPVTGGPQQWPSGPQTSPLHSSSHVHVWDTHAPA